MLTINYPRREWAATGIVVCWFVCHRLSTHLDATALRLQRMDSLHTTISCDRCYKVTVNSLLMNIHYNDFCETINAMIKI